MSRLVNRFMDWLFDFQLGRSARALQDAAEMFETIHYRLRDEQGKESGGPKGASEDGIQKKAMRRKPLPTHTFQVEDQYLVLQSGDSLTIEKFGVTIWYRENGVFEVTPMDEFDRHREVQQP